MSLRLHTLPPELPFVDALAAGILDRVGADPLALSRVTVLLPTARAVRSLREAFLRLSDGRPVLLPRLSPLGEVDADEVALALEGLAGGGLAGGAGGLSVPPSVSPLRRQLLLARLILKAGGLAATTAQAARLAAELARLLDQVQAERLSFERLQTLVPADYAGHWQVTLTFLEIVTRLWPEVLAEEGCVDPAVERDARLLALARAWEMQPPPGPVIAAGVTGSIPATADLLAVVARLPQGAVVLPGLDLGMDEATWAGLDGSHPQAGLKSLLERLGAERRDVTPWPLPAAGPLAVAPRSPAARARLLAEALRPAETTEAWRALPALPPDALAGVSRIDAPTPQEEAGVIALMMRQALETPGRTAALVTPDRALARRVAMALRRWGVEVDDSAGRPLALTPVGSYLRLLADFAATPTPVGLLALLKHPLAAGGTEPAEFRALARALERAVLRGPRPAEGFAGLRRALEAAEPRRFDGPEERSRLAGFLLDLERRIGGLCAAMADGPRPLPDWLELHGQAAELLAATAREPGALRVWAGDDGEAAARFLREAADAASGFPALGGADYAALVEVLMAGRAVRPRYGLHPRLHILGLMEARLQQFDLTILGGLNEGTWPPAPPADPWMSRPMRTAFGLPAPERRIGQTAHDFAQAAGAAELVLTRSERVDGTPTVPSRWLLRLDTVLEAAGLPRLPGRDAGHWLALQAALDWPERVRPCPPPAPTPPVAARPRRLSVTQVETWMRDPYAIYARHILNLQALEPVDADPGAAERGQFIHKALDAFVRAYPRTLPPDALEQLLAFGREAFGPLLEQPAIRAFWWPRFERIAAWFLALEVERRGQVAVLATEARGKLRLDGPAGPFTLVCVADRIDRLPDGSLALVDYKTGTPPAVRDIELGFAPQLPLEALIAQEGGFEGLDAAPVGELAFWKLTGGEPAGEVRPVKGDLADLVEQAREGLSRLIALFDDPATPYRSQPRPGWAPRFSDYGHLARIAEWSAGGGEE